MTANSTMRLGIKALASATFGLVRLSCFDTPAEALAYCCEKLGLAAVDAVDDARAKAG